LAVVLLQEDQPVLGVAAEQAVADAEKVAGSMWYLAENIARAAGAEAKSGAGDRAREALYAALDRPYRSWLETLGPETDATEARMEWQRTVLAVARRLAREHVESAGPAAWTGRELNGERVNVAVAERAFRRGVRKALPLAFSTASKPDQENDDDVDRA
jgi:CRISPR system Cascade subunit CasA